jgi:phosphoribosylamine--glycine ligase
VQTRRVVVVGSGAREDALARALLRSPGVEQVLVAPGNAGTGAGEPRIQAAALGAEVEDLVLLARRVRADLVVIGPEAPLCAGAVDALRDAGILAYGPDQRAAVLEGSKVFLKELASRHGIPTAPFVVVRSMAEAEAAIAERGAPIVVKADGLCAGKGVVVAETVDEALDAARAMLVERRFGDAGEAVVLEQLVHGEEASVHAVSDGERIIVLPAARDHKRVGTGDRGPNTGGMGAYAPTPLIHPELMRRIERTILQPTIDAMRAEGRPFRGTLFAGLMVTPEGDPVLLEHNVRFGDPECEVLMALIEGDLAGLLASAAQGALDASKIRIAHDRAALAVVLAAEGYPAAPRAGDPIDGLAEAAAVEGTIVHHAGTKLQDGQVVTSGGRVLAITSTGSSMQQARDRAYRAARAIHFNGMHFRTDIGAESA